MTLTGKKVLFIDDSKFMHQHCKGILDKVNARTISAFDAEEALDKLESMELLPNIILCDVVLPNMSGIEFRDIIKNDERFENIPFIFVSGAELDDDEIENTEHIHKPFTEEELIDKMKELMDIE
jgi:two-component system response regulator VicR